MRMVRWMCGVKLQDRIPSKELRERLGLDDIISVLQWNRLRWYAHVLRKDDNDLVKKCMEYEVEGAKPRGRPKKTWRETVEKDCQVRGLNREDAMDCSRWRKQISDDWWPRYVWVGECFFRYRLTRVVPDKIHRMMLCQLVKVSRHFPEPLLVQVDEYVTFKQLVAVHMSLQALLDTALETFTFQVIHIHLFYCLQSQYLEMYLMPAYLVMHYLVESSHD